jgi:hypothetical protein
LLTRSASHFLAGSGPTHSRSHPRFASLEPPTSGA